MLREVSYAIYIYRFITSAKRTKINFIPQLLIQTHPPALYRLTLPPYTDSPSRPIQTHPPALYRLTLQPSTVPRLQLFNNYEGEACGMIDKLS